MSKSAKTAYYKLGPKASSFFCPLSRVNILRNVPAKYQGKTTPRMQMALASGHIAKISEDEFDTMMAALPKSKSKAINSSQAVKVVNTPALKTQDELEEMDVEDLKLHAVKFAKNTDELKDVMKMKKADDLIDFIESHQGIEPEADGEDEDSSNEEDEEDEDTTDEEEA